MTYIVTDNCIKCKYMDCVEVCPVDCFYEGENMLVIHPDECIDCGVCEPECPAEAIKPDTEPGVDKWLELNSKYASAWPNITEKRDAPANAKEFDGVEGKLEKYFSTVCLVDQPFVKLPEKTVKEMLTEQISKIGENIQIRRFIRYQLGS